MSGVWGNNIKLSIFGESHGEALGVNIDGLPSGFKIDFDKVNKEMERRAPGRNNLSTSRKEGDNIEVLSGVFNERTTGTPLCGIIRNTNRKSKDYSSLQNIMRPGHADYSGYIRYSGFNDYRGGGHFSGRITAPIVFGGAIFKQLLEEKGIEIFAHISEIYNIKDKEIDFTSIDVNELKEVRNRELAVLDKNASEKMKEAILEAKSQGDSVGGVIEVIILGLEAGVGSPFFNSIESTIAQLAFSIPSVKGIEFGRGFDITKLRGCEANDSYYYENNEVKARSNNNGGIIGGISNGMPIIFRVAIKPTPSIYKEQETIDIKNKENIKFQIEGRHDPCIVQRAVPVIEAISAIGIYDLMCEK